ncbi:CDP-diacylglycerol--glycerol-3-phosphate 3-phosphatidyltransferase [Planctomicrobium sp. SH527]|uniref:CDP-diacylglycerol--glycerol-3-phosphate 3-phosphatidyltransferase n=1 Tax=Planctomicrobium sp. SH527 TaxID=3448123 RepID=UPI003F5BA66E
MSNDAPNQVKTAGSSQTFNIPNMITMSRLVLTFAILILMSFDRFWFANTILFIVAVTTDFVDGYLARKWNQVSTLGRILDPFVDKIIIGGTMIFLTAIPASGVTAWMTFTVIARELFITALRSVLEGQGVDFSAQWSGKVKMLLQSIVIPVAMLSLSDRFQGWLGEGFPTYVVIRDVMLWGMVVVTVYSGVEYIFRAWRIMSRKS